MAAAGDSRQLSQIAPSGVVLTERVNTRTIVDEEEGESQGFGYAKSKHEESCELRRGHLQSVLSEAECFYRRR